MKNFFKKLFQIRPRRKNFKFLICDSKSEAPENTWYRLRKWQSKNFLLMNAPYTRDWKIFQARKTLNGEEEVVGTFINARRDAFLIMGDASDFRVFLEREPDNPKDKNAIKVMGAATVDGRKMVEQLGYLSKETAALLKDEVEIDARPYSVYLPYKDKSFKLYIRILVRSERYKKKNRG